MRFAPLCVALSMWCAVVCAAQVNAPSLTDVDREVIIAALRHMVGAAAGKGYSGVASLPLAPVTLRACEGTTSTGCRDWNSIVSRELASVRPADREGFRAALARRNRTTWQTGSLTSEFAVSTPSPGRVTVSTFQPINPLLKDGRVGGREIVRVSAPAFSPDGRRAVLYMEWVSLCLTGDDGNAYQAVFVAERKDSTWEAQPPSQIGVVDAICPLPPRPVIR